MDSTIWHSSHHQHRRRRKAAFEWEQFTQSGKGYQKDSPNCRPTPSSQKTFIHSQPSEFRCCFFLCIPRVSFTFKCADRIDSLLFNSIECEIILYRQLPILLSKTLARGCDKGVDPWFVSHSLFFYYNLSLEN